ncbi:MAG: LptF/LptG family permease, partial [Candidatus Lindowbacteria bacterium]|nr:LptF/LptG family permease [Candidatus Lindowbacteria bacterium]
MKIVSRYISRVMLTSFLSVLGIFVGLLFIHRLFKIIELAIKQSLGIFETLPLFLWAFPPVLLYSIPISALSAVLVTFGKMAGDNETTAALAAGISRKQLAATPIYFALILSVFAFVNNVFLVPSSYVYFDNIGFGVGIDPIKALKPGRISRMKSRMLSIETIQPEDHRFTKLFAILPSRDIGGEEKGGGRVLLLAERGTWHMSQYAV